MLCCSVRKIKPCLLSCPDSPCRPIPAGLGPALTTRGDRFSTWSIAGASARCRATGRRDAAARWAIARRRATREDRAADPRWAGRRLPSYPWRWQQTARCASGSLTSVFPSTTASAVTTFSPASRRPFMVSTAGSRDHLGELILPLPMVAEADGRALVGPFHRRRLFPYRTLFQRLAGECGGYALMADRFNLRSAP